MNAVVLKDNIDNPFISHLEAKNEKVKFQRIDADVTAVSYTHLTGARRRFQ